MHEAFYGKYNGIFRACANSVYQASPRGGGGLGTRLDMNEIESVEGCYAADLKVEMFSITVSS